MARARKTAAAVEELADAEHARARLHETVGSALQAMADAQAAGLDVKAELGAVIRDAYEQSGEDLPMPLRMLLL